MFHKNKTIKVKIVLIIVLMFLLVWIGQNNSDALIMSNTNEYVRTEIDNAESKVREIAYNAVLEKEAIIDWQSEKVEEYKAKNTHTIFNQKERLNIIGMETYRISFKTTYDALLGPVTVYVDRKTYEVLGFDKRL